jgi:hypothetical protein
MENTPIQIKEMIEAWFTKANLTFENMTDDLKNKIPRLEWGLLLGRAIQIYMIKGRPDRVIIENPITFAKNHQDELENLDKKNFLDFVNSLNEPTIVAGISTIFSADNQRISELKLSDYIDSDELTRGKLFHTIDKLAYMKAHLISKVQTKLDLESARLSGTHDTSNKSMYG